MSSEPTLPFSHAPASSVLFQFADGTRSTYGETARAAGRFARALQALGLREGDRVAVQVEKSAAAIALYLGCIQAGFVFVPFNTGYVAAELEYLLGDATPRVFVCTSARHTELLPLAERLAITLTTLDPEGGSLAEAAARIGEGSVLARGDSSRISAILYTSGTTGRSKGAMISFRNLEFGARALVDAWRFTAADVLLHALPIFHVHGLFIALGTVLASGASMFFLPRFDEDSVFAALPSCTVMMGVPTHYVRLLADRRLDATSAAPIRLFVSGSAPLLPDTFRSWITRTGAVLLERYGMTETSVIASNPYEGERREGSVGLPLAGTELRVVDPGTREPVPNGTVGVVEVRGPHVFSGYWQNPEKTREDMTPDGFFITGDLGRLESGGTLQLVGRGKDLIITGGLNVYPKEVESVLDSVPGVVESAVVGLPHSDFGEAVTAFVVCEGSQVDEQALGRIATDHLAKYKHPKRFVFVSELPRNTMGKVMKNELRREHADLYVRESRS